MIKTAAAPQQTLHFTYFLVLVSLQGFTSSMLGMFLPLYFKQIGMAGVQTGIYFAVSTLGPLLLTMPMGITTDRRSIAAILMISFALQALQPIGFILSTSFALFCITAFVSSFGKRFYSTAMNTMFFKLAGNKNPRYAGLFQLWRFSAMGMGMLVGGMLIEEFSFAMLFAVSLGINTLFILLSLFAPRTETTIVKIKEYKKSVLTPRVLFISFLFLLSCMHWGAEHVAYTPFLKEVLGLNFRQTGIYTALCFFFVGFGAYSAVILLEWNWIKDLRQLLVVGWLLSGVFHILMCIPNVYWSFSFRAIHEIGDGFVFLAFYHGVSKIFKHEQIGGCAAFISTLMMTGMIVGSILFGYVGDRFGYAVPLIASGGILILVPILMNISRDEVLR
ncbi:MAG: MFS transporter [Chitinivibrionales bacterium]|nr:MFS transporter [Chitinivibrionales bacterium]